jgi:hypothetical protein
MPRERARSVAVTAGAACVVVVLAYALLGTVGAALVALAAYGLAVFVLGLVNAGLAAAALMATLAVIVAIDPTLDDSDEEAPPERAQLRETRSSLRESVAREGQARERVQMLEGETAALRRRAGSASTRARRLDAKANRLRRALRRARD